MLDFYDIDIMKNASTQYVVSTVKHTLSEQMKTRWHDQVQNSPKLRTCRQIKHTFSCETYLNGHLTFKQRSALARFRSGTYPLAVELGRYRRPIVPVEQRTCKVCNIGEVENEVRFLVNCSGYTHLSNEFLVQNDETNQTGNAVDDNTEFAYMMSVSAKCLIIYIINCYEVRRTLLT